MRIQRKIWVNSNIIPFVLKVQRDLEVALSDRVNHARALLLEIAKDAQTHYNCRTQLQNLWNLKQTGNNNNMEGCHYFRAKLSILITQVP